jgi:hypothetical protein
MPYGDFARDKRIKRVLSIRLFQDVNIEPRYLASLQSYYKSRQTKNEVLDPFL